MWVYCLGKPIESAAYCFLYKCGAFYSSALTYNFFSQLNRTIFITICTKQALPTSKSIYYRYIIHVSFYDYQKSPEITDNVSFKLGDKVKKNMKLAVPLFQFLN